MAASIAAGESKAEAYRRAHPASLAKPKSLRNIASKQAGAAAVQAELQRILADPALRPVMLDACPEAHNPVQLIEHGVAAMLRLAQHIDPQVSFHAARWLVEFGQANQKALAIEAPADSRLTGAERQAAIEQLRAVYDRALGESPLVVEATPDKSDS